MFLLIRGYFISYYGTLSFPFPSYYGTLSFPTRLLAIAATRILFIISIFEIQFSIFFKFIFEIQFSIFQFFQNCWVIQDSIWIFSHLQQKKRRESSVTSTLDI